MKPKGKVTGRQVLEREMLVMYFERIYSLQASAQTRRKNDGQQTVKQAPYGGHQTKPRV
jgi:hypothetical protein